MVLERVGSKPSSDLRRDIDSIATKAPGTSLTAGDVLIDAGLPGAASTLKKQELTTAKDLYDLSTKGYDALEASRLNDDKTRK